MNQPSIYGNMTLEEFNETAFNLRAAKEYDDLLILGLENGITEKEVKEYYESKVLMLVRKTSENNKVVQLKAENAENAENNSVLKIDKEGKFSTDETAIEKLKREIKDSKDTAVPTVPISEYLQARCVDDEELSKLILLSSKTLKNCFAYVKNKARNSIKGGSGWIDDAVVFGWAEDYYKEKHSDIKVDDLKQKESEQVEPKDNKEKAKSQSKKKDSNVKQTSNKSNTKKNNEVIQLSLFDF